MKTIILTLLLATIIAIYEPEKKTEEIDYKKIAKETAEKVNKKYEGTDEDPQLIIENVKKMVAEQLMILGENSGDNKLEKEVETGEEQTEKK